MDGDPSRGWNRLSDVAPLSKERRGGTRRYWNCVVMEVHVVLNQEVSHIGYTLVWLLGRLYSATVYTVLFPFGYEYDTTWPWNKTDVRVFHAYPFLDLDANHCYTGACALQTTHRRMNCLSCLKCSPIPVGACNRHEFFKALQT